MQSIDLIETYAYRMNKSLVWKIKEIKCNNTIKEYKNVITLIILKKKT